MCGISGIIQWDHAPGSETCRTVRDMVAMLNHRGPDSRGVEVFGNAVLGHSRLSIIDLTDAGHQPMTNEDKSVSVVHNGEIYNFASLRQELEKAGHMFRSNTDTEVLIHGYEEWGIEQLLDRCDGIWAFALWDVRAEKLFLCRDRFGEKPLFYMPRSREIRFASTLQSLFANMNNVPGYRIDMVAEYMACGFIPPDTSIFEGVHKVPPGSFVQVTKSGLSEKPYWFLNYDSVKLPGEELRSELESQLERAVTSRMAADVPLGAFLSGGIDSSLVVSMMARNNVEPLTFTMRVPDTYRDEGEYALAVSKKYNTRHIEIALDESCLFALPELITHIGEPFADSSVIPAQFVAKEIRRYATVVLGGDGGDECFGGYRSVNYLQRLEQLNRMGISKLRGLSPFLRDISMGRSDYTAKILRALLYASDFSNYMADASLLNNKQFNELAGFRLKEAWAGGLRPYTWALNRGRTDRWYQCGLARGIHLVLAGDFLVKVDSASMMHGVEARSPFLTRSLVEFAAKLPAGQIANSKTDKVLLKSLARKLLPVHCVDRQKGGFSIPVNEWIDGPWKPLVNKLLLDGIAVQEGLLDPEGIQCLMRGSFPFQYRRASLLYALLSLELWLRLCVHKDTGISEMKSLIQVGLEEKVLQCH